MKVNQLAISSFRHNTKCTKTNRYIVHKITDMQSRATRIHTVNAAPGETHYTMNNFTFVVVETPTGKEIRSIFYKSRQIRVSCHAVERFRQKTGCEKSFREVERRILEMFGRAKKARFTKPEFAVKELLNHGYEKADHFIMNNWIFVMIDIHEGKLIKSVYQNDYKIFAKA